MKTPEPPHDSDLDPRIHEARAVLWRDVEVTDPVTGEVTTRRVRTQLYSEYLELQAAYDDARRAYTAAQTEAHKTKAGRGGWPMVAGTMQLPVRRAHDRWRAAGADRVEAALAILNQARPEAEQ